MLPLTVKEHTTQFTLIYDLYSASLYGIILKISGNHPASESILIKSFRQFFSQQLQVNNSFIFTRLLQIAIPIISEHTDISNEEIRKMLFTDSHRHHRISG
jgi:hypothetical protein